MQYSQTIECYSAIKWKSMHTCYSKNEVSKYFEWKKPETQCQILYDFIVM